MLLQDFANQQKNQVYERFAECLLSMESSVYKK